MVSIYMEKSERIECENSRRISIICVPGKVHGRVVIERIRHATE